MLELEWEMLRFHVVFLLTISEWEMIRFKIFTGLDCATNLPNMHDVLG